MYNVLSERFDFPKKKSFPVRYSDFSSYIFVAELDSLVASKYISRCTYIKVKASAIEFGKMKLFVTLITFVEEFTFGNNGQLSGFVLYTTVPVLFMLTLLSRGRCFRPVSFQSEVVTCLKLNYFLILHDIDLLLFVLILAYVGTLDIIWHLWSVADHFSSYSVEYAVSFMAWMSGGAVPTGEALSRVWLSMRGSGCGYAVVS